jgi:hypothetical protein
MLCSAPTTRGSLAISDILDMGARHRDCDSEDNDFLQQIVNRLSFDG